MFTFNHDLSWKSKTSYTSCMQSVKKIYGAALKKKTMQCLGGVTESVPARSSKCVLSSKAFGFKLSPSS